MSKRANPYIKTVWVDEETEISASKLNKIEEGIEDAFDQINTDKEAFDTFHENLMEEANDTVKKATADADGNIITETYATKTEDSKKLPMGDGSGTQQMNDTLNLLNGAITELIESPNHRTKIKFGPDSFTIEVHTDAEQCIGYVFHKSGSVTKFIKTVDDVEEGKLQTHTIVTTALYLDILNWLKDYLSKKNNKMVISNAVIDINERPARNTWTNNDTAPATRGDIVNERAYVDTTFATIAQLEALLETSKTDTAKKATADASGNVITTTYATKTELTTSDTANSNARQAILDNLDLKYNSTTGVAKLVHYTDKANDVYTVLGTIDLPSEYLLDTGTGKNYYDSTNKEIVLTLKEGTEIRIPVVNLVDVYNPQDTATISITISQADNVTHERTISAAIKTGSITKTLLEQSILEDVNEAIDGEYGKSTGGTKANPASGTRMAQENTRQANETTRQSNETTRESNEAARNTAEYGGIGYTVSVPASGSRVYNENQRQANETARQNAEAQRALDHTAWDTKVNTTYANTVSGYWDSLLALWNAKDAAIDSDLSAYKLAKDNAIAESLAAYEQSTTADVNTAVSNAVNTYTASIEQWRTVVNTTLGIDSDTSLDSTLDTLAEIINYIKESPNSEYASLIAHVEANTSAASAAQTDINNHKANKNNPHEVTTAQIHAVSYDANQNLGLDNQGNARANLGLGTAAVKNSTASVTSGNTSLVESGAVYTELAKKQNNLTFDPKPIKDSANPVTSNGIYKALDEKVDKVTGKGLSEYDFSGTYRDKVDANTLDRHNHSNKNILDETTAAYTTEEKTKLSGIEAGAQVNVKANWNEKNSSSDAFIQNKPTLGTAAACNTGTSSGNVPILDVNGKLDTSVLPAVAVNDKFTAASEVAMLALTAEIGDICIRTDESKTYILAGTPASTLSNWKPLEHPADAVSSVNSKTGVVTLNADDIDDTSTTHKFVTAADKTNWNGKFDKANIGYIELSNFSGTLTDAQFAEAQKDYCIVNYYSNNVYTYCYKYRSLNVIAGGNSPLTFVSIGNAAEYDPTSFPQLAGQTYADFYVVNINKVDKTYTITHFTTTSYSKDKIDELLNTKQPNLVSGTNIKSINNQSILDSGNLSIETPVFGTCDVFKDLDPTTMVPNQKHNYSDINMGLPSDFFESGTNDQLYKTKLELSFKGISVLLTPVSASGFPVDNSSGVVYKSEEFPTQSSITSFNNLGATRRVIYAQLYIKWDTTFEAYFHTMDVWVEELSSETWTFTMADGTVVTKTVFVKS
jgi:hypothetical protein